MKNPLFEGACTAIVTPFNSNGIDFETLDRQLDFQINAGIAAIVCAGTTGENATLEIHEHNRLVDFCVRKLKGKIKVIVGIGGNNSAHCLAKGRDAALAGADGLLMTPPYYNKCSPQGMIKHFLCVADNVDIPLILYNVPSRTSIGISADIYNELARHKNINGTKEASGDFSLISRIIAECAGELNIWSGNDDNTVAMMAMGAKGVISVLSNIAPQAVVKMCETVAQMSGWIAILIVAGCTLYHCCHYQNRCIFHVFVIERWQHACNCISCLTHGNIVA